MSKMDLSNEQQNQPLSIEEVARLFEVPPHLLIGDSPIISNFSTKYIQGKLSAIWSEYMTKEMEMINRYKTKDDARRFTKHD